MKNNWEFKEKWYKNKRNRMWKFRGTIKDNKIEKCEPFVFISYSHADKDEVIAMVEVLYRVYGLNIWFDEKMGIGDNWWDKASDAMYHALDLLVIVSEDSLKSEPVERELDYFHDELKNTFIYPLNNTGADNIGELIKGWSKPEIRQKKFKKDEWERVQRIFNRYLQGNDVLYKHLDLTDSDFYAELRNKLAENHEKELSIKEYAAWDRDDAEDTEETEKEALIKAINEVVISNLKG